MNRIIVASTAALLLVAVAGSTVAAAGKLRFSGSADFYTKGGTVLIRTDREDDPTWGGPEYGAISLVRSRHNPAWLKQKALVGKPLAGLSISFKSTGDLTGGSPRFSIGIDEDHDRTAEAYAFVDANYCGVGGAPVKDGDTVIVNTATKRCDVWYDGVQYANWAAFAEANPDFRIARGGIFIVADGAYERDYVISRIDLR